MPKLEHRWVAPRQTIVDLLPAGPNLRRNGSILWPASQFTMSLAGFDHVFASAVEMHPAEGLRIRVVPPVVTVLLKIIAYMEDPYRRAKDLQDICVVLARYEAQSDRLFSDAVFDAELPDFEVANAFLLGLDLRALATNDDATYVKEFLEHFLKQEEERHFDEEDFSTKAFRSQIRALNRGFAPRSER